MEYLPIFLDVRGKKVVVDGGETVAARRVERALDAGALVDMYDPRPGEECRLLLGRDGLTHHPRIPTAEDFDGCLVAYGAAEDEERDANLHRWAKEAGALVNVADDFRYCDFITPSVVDRSPIVVAISSGGSAPVISRILRARIESQLAPAYGRLAEFVGGFRDRVADAVRGGRNRRRFWERTIEGIVGDLFLSGDADGAKARMLQEIEDAGQGKRSGNRGEVYLVGAGPGDPDLMTFRALRLMQRADVVLYDRLVGKDILALVRRDAERIYVGKLPDQHTMQQEDITRLMADLALEGKRVLRLKGGDPFIFGRGGEEIELMARENIPFQVVPGITSAAGCGAYAGIPLTHRDHAQACLFVTAHGKDGVLDLDWDVLVRPGQTVAIYMGLSSLPILMGEAVKRGVDGATPAALVENGTRENQRVVTGTVETLVEKANEAGINGPSIIIIGSVVTLHDLLNWRTAGTSADHAMSLTAQDSL